MNFNTKQEAQQYQRDWIKANEIQREDVYNDRGPRFWGRHPMSISSLMQKGVSIPVWRGLTPMDPEPDLYDDEHIGHLRQIMEM